MAAAIFAVATPQALRSTFRDIIHEVRELVLTMASKEARKPCEKYYLYPHVLQAFQDLPTLQTGTDAVASNNRAVRPLLRETHSLSTFAFFTSFQCQGLQMADLPSAYHISLSRVVSIRFCDRESILTSLKDSLAKTKRCTRQPVFLHLSDTTAAGDSVLGSCCSFELELVDLEAFVNEEKTRSFLALSVGMGHKQVGTCPLALTAQHYRMTELPLLWRQVCKAIAKTNRAFLEHGLPRFHEVRGAARGGRRRGPHRCVRHRDCVGSKASRVNRLGRRRRDERFGAAYPSRQADSSRPWDCGKSVSLGTAGAVPAEESWLLGCACTTTLTPNS